jgi:hypothetical protein
LAEILSAVGQSDAIRRICQRRNDHKQRAWLSGDCPAKEMSFGGD